MKGGPIRFQDHSNGSWRRLALCLDNKHGFYLLGHYVQGPHTHSPSTPLDGKQQPHGRDYCSAWLLTLNYLVIFPFNLQISAPTALTVLQSNWLSQQPSCLKPRDGKLDRYCLLDIVWHCYVMCQAATSSWYKSQINQCVSLTLPDLVAAQARWIHRPRIAFPAFKILPITYFMKAFSEVNRSVWMILALAPPHTLASSTLRLLILSKVS